MRREHRPRNRNRHERRWQLSFPPRYVSSDAVATRPLAGCTCARTHGARQAVGRRLVRVWPRDTFALATAFRTFARVAVGGEGGQRRMLSAAWPCACGGAYLAPKRGRAHVASSAVSFSKQQGVDGACRYPRERGRAAVHVTSCRVKG
eukprot:6195626-Pleurochrysis_carterae.AAC.2